MSYWAGKNVAVMGGAGFCGSFVCEQLLALGANVHAIDNLSRGKNVIKGVQLWTRDLTLDSSDILKFIGADVVLNLAAVVTSIEYNANHNAKMFYDNMLLQQVPLESARVARVKRFLDCSTVCVYGHNAPIPTPEVFADYNDPEPTNAGYGFAKLMGEKLATWYGKEYGVEIAITRFANLFGPRDYFDWETSHVIPALIRKCLENDKVEIWGSGEQRREFLYVEDAARGIIDIAEKGIGKGPINIGPGCNYSINELLRVIQDELGTNKVATYNLDKPTGHQERLVDNTKMYNLLGWVPETSLRDGIKKMVEWYKTQ